MIRRAPLAIAALLLSGTAWAQEAPPPLLLRLTLSPEGPVWIGQRVTATLTAMTPVRFVDPPSWPDLTTSQGRILVLPEAATVPGTERVGGQSYAALQRSITLFPMEAGPVVLAPPRLAVRVGGPEGQPVAASAVVEGEARILARAPPGVRDLTRLVVAPVFRLTAGIEGADPAVIRVGEAVVRTLRLEAEDTAAMLLPPAPWSVPEGVRLYPDPPVLHDSSDRGVLRAQRSERAAFVPQRPGAVELPGFGVQWLEPRSGQLREVSVPPLRLSVRPAGDGAETAGRGGLPRWAWPVLAATLLVLGVLGWLLLRWRGHAARQALPIEALARACRAGDARGALRALYRWSDALAAGEAGIAGLAARAGVPALAREAAVLEARLYGGEGGGPAWSGEALLKAARETERKLAAPARHRHGPALPPLNPSFASEGQHAG